MGMGGRGRNRCPGTAAGRSHCGDPGCCCAVLCTHAPAQAWAVIVKPSTRTARYVLRAGRALLTIQETRPFNSRAHWGVGGHQGPHHVLRGHCLAPVLLVRCKVLEDLLQRTQVPVRVCHRQRGSVQRVPQQLALCRYLLAHLIRFSYLKKIRCRIGRLSSLPPALTPSPCSSPCGALAACMLLLLLPAWQESA